METGLELRVLMGLQAGARMALADGRYVLGSGDAVDVVIAGPRVQQEHAALVVRGGRATVAPLNGAVRLADGTPVTAETDLAPGQPLDCDGAWITVAAPGSAWPDAGEILLARARPAEAAPASATAQASAAPGPAKKPAVEKPAMPAPQKPALPAGLWIPVVAALVLLLASAGWLWRAATAPSPPAPVAAKPKVDPVAARGAVIRERVAGLGLAEKVGVQPSGSGWTLVGSVTDESERDKLRLALADLKPAPVLRVYTDDETAAMVSGIIARSGMPVRFAITGPGKGRLTVAAPNAEVAEQVAQAFREELGGVRELETEFITPATLVPSLQELVNRNGLGGRIRITPVGASSPHLLASGPVTNAELERWKDVVTEFGRRHGNFVNVQTAFTRLAPTMPFTVRAVLDGENPQVLTADGHRIFEGGALRGYRLVAVRENELVFDGPERVLIARPKAAAPAIPAAVPRAPTPR
ncbi:MAG TPA: type III secretion system inner membrane ring subunit SctD [Usitatibacter sp.]|nr:type III secretion system inner membrane ring subunit SctD [Usitatibacter sp.]